MAEAVSSIALYYGEDEFLVERAVRAAVIRRKGEASQPEVVDGNLHTASDWERFLRRLGEILFTPHLLNPECALWVRDLSFLNTVLSSDNEKFIDAFFSLLDAAARWHVPLFLSASPVDGRLRAFKRLTSHPVVTSYLIGGGSSGCERFLVEELERRGLTMTATVRLHLLELVGGPARLLVSELEKLELTLHPRKTVTKADVDAICNEGPVQNCFALTTAYYERNEPVLVRELQRFFSEKKEPRVLLAALQSHCRTLLQLKALDVMGIWSRSGISLGEALERAKRHCLFLVRGEGIFAQNSFYLCRLTPQLRLWTLDELERAQRSFLEIFLQLLHPPWERTVSWWASSLILP